MEGFSWTSSEVAPSPTPVEIQLVVTLCFCAQEEQIIPHVSNNEGQGALGENPGLRSEGLLGRYNTVKASRLRSKIILQSGRKRVNSDRLVRELVRL